MGKLIIGIICSFLGFLITWDALTTTNSTQRLGGYTIALIFFLIGIPLFIKGIKSISR